MAGAINGVGACEYRDDQDAGGDEQKWPTRT
jgi:hypothetical protein